MYANLGKHVTLIVALIFTWCLNLCQASGCSYLRRPHPQGFCGEALARIVQNVCMYVREQHPEFYTSRRHRRPRRSAEAPLPVSAAEMAASSSVSKRGLLHNHNQKRSRGPLDLGLGDGGVGPIALSASDALELTLGLDLSQFVDEVVDADTERYAPGWSSKAASALDGESLVEMSSGVSGGDATGSGSGLVDETVYLARESPSINDDVWTLGTWLDRIRQQLLLSGTEQQQQHGGATTLGRLEVVSRPKREQASSGSGHHGENLGQGVSGSAGGGGAVDTTLKSRGKRDLVCECCYSACSVSIIARYC